MSQKPSRFRVSTRTTSLMVLSAAILAACGGGGDTAVSEPVAVAPAPAPAPGPAPAPTPEPPPAAGTVRASFTATDQEFPNPERGFYRWAWSNLEALSAADAQDAYLQGYRLVYAPLNLSAYRSADLPASLLTQLEAAFGRARSAGIKLVVRAVYNYPENETDYRNAQDAPLARVLGHIAQLKPVLQRHGDVIAVMQAGFIGAWGEWHTSSNQLTTVSNRTQVRDALLDAVPPSRFIQVRYPPYVMDWTPTLPALSVALSGGYRVGVHNDCFLASTTDVGTYSDNSTQRTAQRDYVDRLGQLAPFGGETCDPADEASPTPRTACADILAEGARYKLTYLNAEYHRTLFHDRWERDGCMAEVKRKMGYRLQLVAAAHADAVGRGESLALSLTVRNTGWARVFNPRGLQVVLRDTAGTTHRLDASGADPRAWLPGAEQAVALQVTVPPGLAAGSYTVWMAWPDADARLVSDARYAIRPANADSTTTGQRWDATLGAFSTGTSVIVR
jgi:hypothetical protein